MNRASSPEHDRELTDEELDALLQKRQSDRDARIKRAHERLKAIEDEEQVVLIAQPKQVAPEPGRLGFMGVEAVLIFLPREAVSTPRPEQTP